MVNKICVRCGMEYPDHKMSCKIPVEEWRLPTAEELILKKLTVYNNQISVENAIKLMNLYGKLHVEAALKAAMKKTYKKVNMRHYEDELYKDEILTKTIIKAYPLNNVK